MNRGLDKCLSHQLGKEWLVRKFARHDLLLLTKEELRAERLQARRRGAYSKEVAETSTSAEELRRAVSLEPVPVVPAPSMRRSASSGTISAAASAPVSAVTSTSLAAAASTTDNVVMVGDRRYKLNFTPLDSSDSETNEVPKKRRRRKDTRVCEDIIIFIFVYLFVFVIFVF